MITKAKNSCCWSRYKTCKTHQVDPRGKEWTKIDGSMKSVRCQTNKSKQMKNASIDGDGDGDGHGDSDGDDDGDDGDGDDGDGWW